MDLQKMKDDPTLGPLDAAPQNLNPSPKPKRTERLRPMDGVDAELKDGEYEQLLEMYDQSLRTLAEGEVVRGRVLRISGNEVIVDVGYKSEGIIDKDEFLGPDGQIHIKVGDEIDVLLEKTENKDGYVVLSKEKAEKMKVWEEIERAYADGRPVTGVVKERIKGGLAVDIGVRAFLPGSLVDLRPVRNLDAMKGKELQMRVIKVNRKRGNIVLSRKAVLEEENTQKKRRTLDALTEGKIVRGVVKNITEYGAFIDLGGIDGLLHKTDMSWGRIKHPSKVLAVGDTVEAVVLDVDKTARRLSLGLRQTEPNPWQTISEKYHEGDRIVGKVRNLTDFGAFIEVEEGIDGLVHISDMSWTKRLKHPSEMLKKGDDVDAVILKIDSENQRLSLGIKQLQPNIWEEFFKTYSVGDLVTGRIVRLTDFGAFVEISEGIEGLVHVSEIAEERVDKPSDKLRVDDAVTTKIIKMDIAEQKIGLSIKAAVQDQSREELKNYMKSQGGGSINLGEVAGHSGRRREEKRRRGRDGFEESEDED